MFQEFVNRTGFDAAGHAPVDASRRRAASSGSAGASRQLFFVFVLGGEDPIDHVQRRSCAAGRELHPLLERIMRIHVTEEARHLSFARHYLKHSVPGLPRRQRVRLAVAAPLILGEMAQMMLKPSRQLITKYQIPRAVIAEAYTRNPGHRAETAASLSKVRKLCAELRLTRPPYRALWRLLRLEAGPAACPARLARQAEGSRAAGTARSARQGRCAEEGVMVDRPRALTRCGPRPPAAGACSGRSGLASAAGMRA